MNATLLHANSSIVTYDELKTVRVPSATRTYSPIPHVELLDTVKREITSSGLIVARESLIISRTSNGRLGDRFFGLLEIEDENGNSFRTAIGLRNSHDRRFPAGLCVGSRVMVCDNLAFSAEIVIARKHTKYLKRDLPRLINQAVGRLGDLREHQANRIETYRNTTITEPQVHDLSIRALDAGVIAASKIPKVLEQYRKPPHEEFSPRTVWSLFNAFTEVLKTYDLQDLPRRTQTLQGLCDVASHMN